MRGVYAACAASFALGLFFIFVWTPLPWGWQGIDDYYAIALALARGEPFPTVHIPWGYAYFLAAFYRLFGDHPWIPLTAQAAVNACVPLMVYRLARRDFGERVAVFAAWLAGLLSFNTVYAATQSADSMCTVLVVATMVCFARGVDERRAPWFAASGLLAGVAYQFRPNLVLFAPFLALLAVWVRGGTGVRTAVVNAAALLVAFAVAGAPWVIRNYRWTGLFIPATTHGGAQLWFGTLQTGPYRDSWLYNPRAAFEYPPVDYTSLDELPIVITAEAGACEAARTGRLDVVYWTGGDRTPKRIAAALDGTSHVVATIPAQPSGTAVYFAFADRAAPPAPAPVDPETIVVSRDHLGDLDVDGHALDVFDVVRMVRHAAWNEPLTGSPRLDFDGDGVVDERDIRRAAALVVDNHAEPSSAVDPVASLTHDGAAATIVFRDGSSLSVPRSWSGRVTDLELRTPKITSLASQIVSRSRTFASLTPAAREAAARAARDPCASLEGVGANRVPYRRLPHELRRFTALSIDNIRHDPVGFAAASALRLLRVFIIEGSEDRRTAYQFAGAGRVYVVGRALSIVYAALFAAGLGIAVRRRLRPFVLLAPIVYVPLTICFVLVTARYSMTTQPFVFAFIALALDALRRR